MEVKEALEVEEVLQGKEEIRERQEQPVLVVLELQGLRELQKQ